MSDKTPPQQGAGSSTSGQPAGTPQQQGQQPSPKPQQQGGPVIRDWASI